MNIEIYTGLIETREFRNFEENIGSNSFVSHTDFVSEMLEGEYYKWNNRLPVFISAPTGSGKNTFIESYIQEFSYKKVLVLSNRISLNRQSKIRLLKKLGETHFLDELTERGLDKLEKIANVTLMTYQKFLYLSDEKKNDFEIVIADEIQFVDCDSVYNPWTSVILDRIIEMKQAIRIYMTATPNYIFNEILNRETNKYLKSTKHMVSYINYGTAQFSPYYYNLIKKCELINKIIFFKKFEDLLTTIKKSSKKWLIFVENIIHGEQIVTMLQSIGKTSKLVTSFSKNDCGEGKDEFDLMIQEECFLCDCLVTTKVIETGVNQKMKDLKNLVIFNSEPTSFLQMVGRKRMISSNDTINLYCYLLNMKDINKELQRIGEKMETIYNIDQIKSKKSKELFINSNSFINNKKLCYYKDNAIKTNPLAWNYLKRRQRFFEMLKSEIKNEELAFAIMVIHWLYPEKSSISLDDIHIVQDEESINQTKNHFKNLLTKYQSKKLTSDEESNFRQEFSKLTYQHFPDFRNRGILGKVNINKIIKNLNLDYEVTTLDKKWFVKNMEVK